MRISVQPEIAWPPMVRVTVSSNMESYMPRLAMLFMGLALTSATAIGQDAERPPAGWKSAPQEIEATVNKGTVLFFRTVDYSAFICTDPRASVRANWIARGLSYTTDPAVDAGWLKQKQAEKNCWQQVPNERFLVTQATA